MKKTLLLLFSLAILAGCAEGSALVIGDVRPAIEDHTMVKILTTMPEGAEQIALVKASSGDGWNQQQSLDYAVDELKRQAAKVGANAVVLSGQDTSTEVTGVPVYGGGTIVTSSETQIVKGMAIWID